MGIILLLHLVARVLWVLRGLVLNRGCVGRLNWGDSLFLCCLYIFSFFPVFAREVVAALIFFKGIEKWEMLGIK